MPAMSRSDGIPAVAGARGSTATRYGVANTTIAIGLETVLCGLAAPFNVQVPSTHGGLLEFRPGAFAEAIRRNRVSLLLEHAATSPTIATTSDQTLDLWEGADGLMFRMNPPTSLAATTVLGRARRDAFAGVSIGFRLCASVFVETEGLHSCRSADLVEVSLVSKQGVGPTFAGTWVRVMSLRDSWRLEAAAKVDVAMVSSRNVSYGGLRGYLRADAVYRVDVSLARMLVSAGWATLVVR